MKRGGIFHVPRILCGVIEAYTYDFLPEIKRHVSFPPPGLRCGVARGQIVSIGDGRDFVGSCINIASRLQKLSTLSFAISRRGFDVSDVSTTFWNSLCVKKVHLAGISDEELVLIRQSEFNHLTREEKSVFKEPSASSLRMRPSSLR
jgi:hypothetical protein